jgi:hypothetical protein
VPTTGPGFDAPPAGGELLGYWLTDNYLGDCLNFEEYIHFWPGGITTPGRQGYHRRPLSAEAHGDALVPADHAGG